MLAVFIVRYRAEIAARTRALVAGRRARAMAAEPIGQDDDTLPGIEDDAGLSAFLDEIIVALSLLETEGTADREPLTRTAGGHGQDLHRRGLPIAYVVREYGDVRQTITAMAVERDHPISPDDLAVLNGCVDDAIAEAVTAYARQNADTETHRFASFTHELRNLVGNAVLSFEILKDDLGAMKSENPVVQIHARNLQTLTTLIERAIVEVRLDGGIARIERMHVLEFVSDVAYGAALQAKARKVRLIVPSVIDTTLAITGDRQLLASALANLLQNAIKFTPAGGTVELSVAATDDQVVLSVMDECGGLPPGNPHDLFRPFRQASADRSGFGMGLTICRKAAEANGGSVHVRDVPGHGCVFSLELPRTEPPSGKYELQLPARLGGL